MLVSIFYILADFLSSCSLNVERIVLKPPTEIVDLSMSLFYPIIFFFIYFVVLLFGAYTSVDYLTK